MSILIVVAHPDDEVLGCGATVETLTRAGASVRACILSGTAEARRHRPASEDLLAHTRAASRVLGMGDPILGDFPNLALNTVPQLKLVQFIEAALLSTGADTIFTHHPADLNNDHLHVSRACQAASRLSRRREGVTPVGRLYFMEVLSSTDWAVTDGSPGFRPDSYMPIDAVALDRKLDALAEYDGVVRPAPHSRSVEAIRALATVRGAESHALRAEAFQSAYTVLSPQRLLV